MGRLRERRVQELAVKWVTDRCRQERPITAITNLLEAVIKRDSKLGSGRADGYVAARMADGSIHTIAIEAKSHRTIYNLAEYTADDPWLLHGLVVGVLGAAAGAGVGWLTGSWLISILLAVVGFVGFSLGYLKLTEDHQGYKVIDAVAQVQRYPANERWVAISTDVYNTLEPHLQLRLHRQCRQKGIGLLRISSATSITLLEAAVSGAAYKSKPDYLQCYARGEDMRRQLSQADIEVPADSG